MTSLTEAISQVRRQQQAGIISMQVYFNSRFPDVIQALRRIDYETTEPKRRAGFNLVKRENKKNGFLYYVRYSHNGKMLPTKWNTGTNNIEKAEKFAMNNKTRYVENYLAKQDGRMFTMLEKFYDTECGHLSERTRRDSKKMLVNKFIPFLQQEKITSFAQITTSILRKYQFHLKEKGMKPQTVKVNINPVRNVFAHLFRKGMILENPCDRLKGLPVHKSDRTIRGCYDLDKPKGVFNRRWKDDLSFLLALLIYTTGMRNCEIKRIRLEGITNKAGVRYINISKSKTESGERDIPVHNFVYNKLKAWAVKNKKTGYIFESVKARCFKEANKYLAKMLGVSDEYLKNENITFYSGRHFWKTLMHAEGLGEDIEEIWMGHKVTTDVKRLYNHQDKQGKKRLTKKAQQVFSILDRCLFKKTKP